MSLRNSSLGIAQDRECVTWEKLLQLREKYNSIWFQLSECGAASGDAYGTAPHLEEINVLPTVEGFFRLSVNISGDYANGYVATPGVVHFILTGGTLLDRISNPNFNYLSGAKKPFNFILYDECKNCSNFRPKTVSSAFRSISCNGTPVDLYFGFKEFTIESGDTGCGNILNWGDNIAELNDHLDNFEPYIEVPAPSNSNCQEFVASCCSLWDVGHYETVGYAPDGADVRVLRYIDIFVTNLGAPAITGHLAPLIYADELEEIRTRISSDIASYQLTNEDFCDECGPSVGLTNCASTSNRGFACNLPLSFSGVSISNFVTGLAPDCTRCSESGFFGTICTCPWEELALVMDFILANGCPHVCVDQCSCPSASSSSSAEICDDPFGSPCNNGDTGPCCYAPDGFDCGPWPDDPCNFTPI